MDNEGFWIPKPRLWGLQTYSILLPVLASVIGLFLMSIEAFVFAQFDTLPVDLRMKISLASAIFIAFGGEVGTISNTVFIFSRYATVNTNYHAEWDKITIFDWSSLIVSWLSTVMAAFIAASTRPNTITSWQQIFAEWLIIPLFIVAVSDIYSGAIELGTVLGQFNIRMIYWIKQKRLWQEEQDRIKSYNAQNHNLAWNETKVLPQKEVQDDAKDAQIRCWCGKELKSERAYNAHLRFHKNEVKEKQNAKDALDFLQSKYQNTIANSSIPFPTLSQIANWFI